MTDTLSHRLARFAASLRHEDLPPAVVDKAKACVLHCVGVGLAGHSGGAVQAARAAVMATEHAPERPATILVDGAKATPYGAAFVNSALMHARLQEDAYKTASHPGTMIIPAALAAAELCGVGGRDFLTAVVAGYEVQAAMSNGFIARSNARAFRSSPAYGPFGTAVAAGRILGLGEQQLAQALGYAATFAGGTFEGGMGTHIFVLQVAQATRSGLLAAYLAREGATASATALDGRTGFYQAFTGSTEGLDDVGTHLGSRWEILEVTLKRYPAAMFNQAPIHLAAELSRAHDLRPEAIRSILVEMNEFETTYPSRAFSGRGGRAIGPAGLGSTAFSVAAASINRGFIVPADRPAGWSSPVDGIERLPTHAQSLDLAERVEVVGSQDVPPLAPRVTVTLADGSVFRAVATGDEFKLGLAEDKAIIRGLLPDMPITADQLERLIAAVDTLDKAPGVANLVAAATT